MAQEGDGTPRLQSSLSYSQWIYNTVIEMAATGTSVHDLCILIADRTRMFVPTSGGSIMLYDKGEQCLKIEKGWGLNEEENELTFKEWEGFAGHAYALRTMILSNDAQNDGRFKKFDEQNYEIKSLMSCPFFLKGEPIGVLNLHNKIPDNQFEERDKNGILMLCAIAGPMLGNVILADKIKEASLYERTTSLYRRETFIDQVNSRLKKKTKPFSSMILLNLDNFHQVRNSIGYIKGEEILRKIGVAIHDLLLGRDGVYCAHWGGEEYAIFIETHYTREGIDLLEQIQQTIAQIPFAEPVRSNFVSCVAGIVTKASKEATFDNLIMEAYVNMYAERRGKKGKEKAPQESDSDDDLAMMTSS